MAGGLSARLPLPDLSAWKIFEGATARRREWRWPDTPVPSLDVEEGEDAGDPVGRHEADASGPDRSKGGEGMPDNREAPAEPEIPAAALGPLGALFAGQMEPVAPGDLPPAGW